MSTVIGIVIMVIIRMITVVIGAITVLVVIQADAP